MALQLAAEERSGSGPTERQSGRLSVFIVFDRSVGERRQVIAAIQESDSADQIAFTPPQHQYTVILRNTTIFGYSLLNSQ
jgi:hypothetical protein